MGGDDPDPPPEAIVALVAELDEDPDDIEHVCVSVVHENDWGVSAYIGRRVTLDTSRVSTSRHGTCSWTVRQR
jgi:hypothetical protein